MKILFLISALGIGGAERGVFLLSKMLAAKGHSVEVVRFDRARNSVAYPFPAAVMVTPLEVFDSTVKRRRNNPFKGVLILIRLLQHIKKSAYPEIIIAQTFGAAVIALLLTFFVKIPVIVTENVACEYLSWPRKLLRKVLLPRATRIVAVGEALRAQLPKELLAKSVVIPNPIVLPEHYSSHGTKTDHITIGALGRLEAQKGFDLLLRAFARALSTHPTLTLVIWGEGKARDTLCLLIEELTISHAVTLAGATSSPMESLSTLDLFVLSSRHEGLPGALCEAMACGKPCISFDCPHGPKEVFGDSECGILVPAEDIEALAQAIARVADDPQLRARLGNAARERIEQRYSPEAACLKYVELLNQVVMER